MANKKGKKSGKKAGKAKAKPTPGQAMRANPMPRRALVQRALRGMDIKMCNPFNPNTQGCKYPDGQAGFTIPIQVRGLMSLSTVSTTGGCAWAFGAGFPYNTAGSGGAPYTFANGSATFPNATLTAILANGGTLRPVCGGIIIRSQQSAMNAQGTVIITKVPAGVPNGTVWSSGVIYGDARTYPLVAGMEVCVLLKPQGPVAYDFQPVNTSAFEARDWDNILVEVMGATATAATPVLEIEYLCNYEVIPAAANVAYQQLASPTKDNPLARHVTKSVWDRVGSFIAGGVDKVTDRLSKLAVEAAGSAVGAMIGGPPGAVAGGMLALTVD